MCLVTAVWPALLCSFWNLPGAKRAGGSAEAQGFTSGTCAYDVCMGVWYGGLSGMGLVACDNTCWLTHGPCMPTKEKQG